MKSLSLSILACLLFHSSTVLAVEPRWQFSGQACQADDASDSNSKMSTHGTYNSSTSARIRVWCPFRVASTAVVDITVRVDNAKLYLENNTSHTGTNYQFTCGLKYRSKTGTVYSSTELTESSSGYHSLSWTSPFGTTVGFGGFSAYCYIPVTDGTSSSYVLGDAADYTFGA